MPENKTPGIQDRIRKLYEKKLSSLIMGLNSMESGDLREKLLNIRTQIEELSKQRFDPASKEYMKMLEVESKLNKIDEFAIESGISRNDNNSSDAVDSVHYEKLYEKIINSFFYSLNENGIEKENKTGIENNEPDNTISDKLKSADKIIDELKANLNNLFDITVLRDKENLPEINVSEENIFEKIRKEPEEDTGNKIVIEAKKIIETEITVHDPIIIHPKIKMEGIFNDENLTEDYELGFRFHQLGLKTGFFNVKLDSHDESSRISTAEFFPNKFWGSVKQRSRWIAGICLQNWKAHKWKGNLTTKYFMFRDRKPLFSLFGAFFSNMIFFYLLYAVFCTVFKISNPVVLLSSSSVLWYLVIVNVFFMVSRVVQRFVFTYNWYGFRFALFSLTRLLVDTVVNFCAIIRSIKVFNQTKKKVVWDSTTHY